LALGLSLQGSRWHRPEDTVAIAAVNNAISGVREAYLNAGGLGILVGDGRLPHPVRNNHRKATIRRRFLISRT